MNYYVYILANSSNVTIYTGVTNNLIKRVYEHKTKADAESLTAKYNIHKLVYYEMTNDVRSAIERERQIKSWNRKRKNLLVEKKNPTWIDLYPKLLG